MQIASGPRTKERELLENVQGGRKTPSDVELIDHVFNGRLGVLERGDMIIYSPSRRKSLAMLVDIGK